jgi:hypothetical protein
MALIIVELSLNTSIAKDGPLNVTKPLILLDAFFLIDLDQTSSVKGSNPLATLITIGFVFNLLKAIDRVSKIKDEGTDIKIYCGLINAICEKLFVAIFGARTNFLLPK